MEGFSLNPGEFLQLLRSIKLVSYFDVAAVSLFIWDYLLTLEMEIELVWMSNWSFTKCLYLLQRYLPFVDTVWLILYQKMGKDLTIAHCQKIYDAIGWSILFGTALSEMLLTLRAWAVWERDRRMSILLPILFILFWGPDIAFMVKFLNSLRFGEHPYPGFLGCLLYSADEILFVCFLDFMLWDTLILIFIMIPGYQAYQVGGNSALFHVVYRDGAIYYLYAVALSCINVVTIKTFPPGAHYIFLSVQRCIHSMLASRVLLHIRAYVKTEQDKSSQSLNEIQTDQISSQLAAESRQQLLSQV